MKYLLIAALSLLTFSCMSDEELIAHENYLKELKIKFPLGSVTTTKYEPKFNLVVVGYSECQCSDCTVKIKCKTSYVIEQSYCEFELVAPTLSETIIE